MKKLLTLLLLLPALLCSAQQTARRTPAGMGYLEYLPASYHTDTANLYPCIIFLHGSGEKGSGSMADLEKVKRHGIPKHIAAGSKMCFVNPITKVQECFIVLSPQTYKWSWRGDVIPFAKWARLHYRIDTTRLYVTGLSMGGEGTWFSACFDDNNPNIWAALAPVCGRASQTEGGNVSLKQIPVWGFHGSADASISLTSGVNPIMGMIKNSGSRYQRFTVYEGGSHATAWDRAYRTDHAYHNPNLYEWFLTKKKP